MRKEQSTVDTQGVWAFVSDGVAYYYGGEGSPVSALASTCSGGIEVNQGEITSSSLGNYSDIADQEAQDILTTLGTWGEGVTHFTQWIGSEKGLVGIICVRHGILWAVRERYDSGLNFSDAAREFLRGLQTYDRPSKYFVPIGHESF